MHGSAQCSTNTKSELVDLFVRRSGAGPSAPPAVMESMTATLRRRIKYSSGPVMQLGPFLSARNVVEFHVVRNISCDGYLEPRGNSFSDGFSMAINHDAAEERIRFTMAHELCHTFFYELVPELKYRNRKSDDCEEALCNVGAAAFLMPASGLRRRAGQIPVCIESLETLAAEYRVSLPAMFLRLRDLQAWKCQLSVWHPSPGGGFRLERIYGGKSLNLEWMDDSVPGFVWESKKAKRGHTCLQYFDERRVRYVKPVSYQLVRRGNGLIALWGRLTKCVPTILPLFGGPEAPAR